ncbi:MAG: hypothetical protein A3B68_04090 [Candidatus Melainabacteria bacterium RIFCSPHIGHO2_02_FULL_34_12]|nr:MAG: hypothetical protein A3B68_04090 [Candidatus Melainabacteria bacterium RIFCSPHIGHO2_02_FULL_34_12]
MSFKINRIMPLNQAQSFRGIKNSNQAKAQPAFCPEIPNHFLDKDLNPSNPSSWSSAISNLMSDALGSLFCLEAESTGGIFGDPAYNPYENRHKRFIAMALLGKMYTLLPLVNSMTEENKKANKMENLALAA